MKKTIEAFVMVFGFLFAQNLFAQSVTGTNTISGKNVQAKETGSINQKESGFIVSNTDGVCDNRSGHLNRSRNFIDSNNDGICDNKAFRGMRGGGRNFVDANNDGVCDHFKDGRQGRCNQGQGFRHRHGQR
jgi:hypothetical protein